MSSITRSMARDIARINMKKAGYRRKDHASGWFSKNWRMFVPVKEEKR